MKESVLRGCDARPLTPLLYPGWGMTLPLVLRPLPLLASDVAFAIVFGVFLVALVVLIVIVLLWAVRRDRDGRAAWRQRQQTRATPAEGDQPPAPGA